MGLRNQLGLYFKILTVTTVLQAKQASQASSFTCQKGIEINLVRGPKLGLETNLGCTSRF